jgi:CpeT protein
MRTSIGIVSLTIALLAGAACESMSRSSGQADAEAFAFLANGAFSSEAQFAADPSNFRDVKLTLALIWKERKGGRWLYYEEAFTESAEKPYRQRVLHVYAKDDQVLCDLFALPGDPARFAGAWADVSRFDSLAPDQLRRRDGCTLHLHREPDNSFKGSTEGQRCQTDAFGSAWTTCELTLGPHMLTWWERAYDSRGIQVAGPIPGPYEFGRKH